MCSRHYSTWRNLFLEQQAHILQQCHFGSGYVPPSPCENRSPFRCCSAPAFPACRCCSVGPLPVNTGYTSPSYCPRRYPITIESRFRNACCFKNADKYESTSEDEDNYSSSSDSCNEIQSLSKDKHLIKMMAGLMKKQFKEEMQAFSKSEQAYIKRKAEILIKQYKGEDCSDSCSEIDFSKIPEIRTRAINQQILIKARDEIMKEEEEEEVTFKISDDYNRLVRCGDSADEDASDEDASDEEASDEEASDEEASDEEASDEDASDEDASDEEAYEEAYEEASKEEASDEYTDAPDTKPEVSAEPPK